MAHFPILGGQGLPPPNTTPNGRPIEHPAPPGRKYISPEPNAHSVFDVQSVQTQSNSNTNGVLDLRVKESNQSPSDLVSQEGKLGLNVKCDVCTNLAAFLCASCKKAAYCGRQCQMQGWDQHKSTCSFG
ncbi:hypothetical protein CAPTEDRAFT_222728 [Capitella teleta]|uniref:MYND-type domain-containing protein n=1 Tax=Capitella teleta TaxID=283909 RepID=R7T9U1_CAPTE|nr:hypothetical protein CAPTEDRAFT_222728 [Capitella teleta]|eukprot:ELT90474.1 hypothetical protein CAPTEDRAFT_222728 [Capitella teleta]